MKFEDILAFAKAGYKPSEIKELLEMETSSDVKTEDIQTPEEATPNQPTEENKPEADEIDYKKLYEESQKQLKQAQQANRNTASTKTVESDDDLAMKFIRSITRGE